MCIHQDTYYEIRESTLRFPKIIFKEKRTISTIRVDVQV